MASAPWIFLLLVAFQSMGISASGTAGEVAKAATAPTLRPPAKHLSTQRISKMQYECNRRMLLEPPYNGAGKHCNRTWDGWLCWGDVAAGEVAVQHCPDYFPDFDLHEKVTKICNVDGQWFRHPDSNRTWSNYTLCNAFTADKLKMAVNLFYLAVTGHGVSILVLLISLTIFFYFKSLSCQRITLHKNLFMSYILNSIITIIQLTAVANNQELVASKPVWCKVLQFFYQYMMGCNYFWMLCEGIYLHTLIVVAVFAEKQHLFWYYLLGWGFPIIPALLHAAARTIYYDDNCWISSATHLLYIIHGPVVAALLFAGERFNNTSRDRVEAGCKDGEPVLPAEHRARAGDQAEGDAPRRVEHVHEGGARHAHPRAAARHPVRARALEARGPLRRRHLRLRHARAHALPGISGGNDILLLQRRGAGGAQEVLDPVHAARGSRAAGSILHGVDLLHRLRHRAADVPVPQRRAPRQEGQQRCGSDHFQIGGDVHLADERGGGRRAGRCARAAGGSRRAEKHSPETRGRVRFRGETSRVPGLRREREAARIGRPRRAAGRNGGSLSHPDAASERGLARGPGRNRTPRAARPPASGRGERESR